jgi:hypothetical protein
MTSPSRSARGVSTGVSFTVVPLVLFKSSIHHDPSRDVRHAWWPETVSSSTTKSLSRSRPILVTTRRSSDAPDVRRVSAGWTTWMFGCREGRLKFCRREMARFGRGDRGGAPAVPIARQSARTTTNKNEYRTRTSASLKSRIVVASFSGRPRSSIAVEPKPLQAQFENIAAA